MKKFLLLAVTGFVSGVSAHTLEFTLPCTVEKSAPKEVHRIPPMTFVKKAVREKGKWSEEFSLRIAEPGGAVEIPFTPAFNGDEDYNEYTTVGENKYNISGANIQNRFQWGAVLVDGSNWIFCEK